MKSKIFIISMLMTIVSCGGSNENQTEAPEVIKKPTNISAASTNGVVSISWSQSNDSDIYVSTESGLSFENYASFENSEWIKDVTSPFEYVPETLIYKYFFTVVNKNNGVESTQSDTVASVPRYIDKGEYVEDLYTNLVWMKCAIGQTYKNESNACEGNATRLKYDASISLIESTYPEWRIPNLAELISLVYCESGNPDYFLDNESQSCEQEEGNKETIFSEIFAGAQDPTEGTNTPIYRTSTEVPKADFPDQKFIRIVNFSRGDIGSGPVQQRSFINLRLVKDK